MGRRPRGIMMKATIERATLLKGLSHVQSVVERRNTIPILSNVLLRAERGELRLRATDLDIEVTESLPADVAAASPMAPHRLRTAIAADQRREPVDGSHAALQAKLRQLRRSANDSAS